MPGNFRWTQPELDYLQDLAGDYPLSWIVKDYNRWAARNGYTPRTKTAIKKAICIKLQQSTVPFGEWISTADVAKMVGRAQKTVREWVAFEFICRDHRRYDGNGYLICRRGLRQLARDRPYLLKHLNREQLFHLLEDEDVVDLVLESPIQQRRLIVPVRCVETQTTFPSISAAANAFDVHPTSLRMSIVRRGTCRGLHFQEAA